MPPILPHGTPLYTQPLPTAAAESTQHLLVLAESDSATGAMLYLWHDKGAWQQEGEGIPVSLGRGGLGKRHEGDGKTPVGIFTLGEVFGYDSSAPDWLRMPYRPMQPDHECVDDADSRYYNQVLQAGQDKDWHSSEMMRRDIHHGDDLYKYGIVVEYNPAGQQDNASGKGAGSCIFIHIYRGPAKATAGCTAMAEDDLLRVLRFLDAACNPLLVQGSRAYLTELFRQGSLPYPLPASK